MSLPEPFVDGTFLCKRLIIDTVMFAFKWTCIKFNVQFSVNVSIATCLSHGYSLVSKKPCN